MVPESWHEIPLSELVTHDAPGHWGTVPGEGDVDVAVARSTNFSKSGYADVSKVAIRGFPLSKAESKSLQIGDILIERSGGSPDQPVGRVVLWTQPGQWSYSNFLQRIRVRADKASNHFVFFELQKFYYSGGTIGLQAATTGIRNLTYKDYTSRPIALPPLPEQKKIAKILTSVDEAIAATKAVIEQTKKVKQGLLQELLTKGIGHTEFKDTPIGKIPASWELKRLDELARVERGRFSHRPRNAPHLYGGPYPFLQTGDVAASDRITSFKQTLTEEGMATSKFFSVGTILVSIVGANLGSAAITTFEAACPDSVIAITPKSVVREWLFQVALTWKIELQGRATQSARQNINLATLRPFLIAVPNENEQKKISEAAVAFDEVYTSGNERLRRLRTIKAGLLQDLLTGKVRVNL